MGPPSVSLVLLVVLGLTATLHAGLTMVHAEVSGVPEKDTPTTNKSTQCSPLQRRQNLLDAQLIEVDKRMTQRDTRLNGLDTRLSAQLNDINTRLSTQHEEGNARLNKLDSRLDGIETAISDMKQYLQERLEAMDKKVEWALADNKPQQAVSTAQPHPTPLHHDDVTQKPQVYVGCQDALTHGANTSGVYTIALDQEHAIAVYCEQRVAGGGWTVFQVRYNGSVDFYNDWNSYSNGFGDLNGEFWLGNTNIHLLTKHKDQQLKIELTSREGEMQYADYSLFYIDDAAHKFRLTVSGFSGGSPPGDSFSHHNGSRFSTKDQDNDEWPDSCAVHEEAAWWYSRGCGYSNLNGIYDSQHHRYGIMWYHWKGSTTPMRATRMMLRKRP